MNNNISTLGAMTIVAQTSLKNVRISGFYLTDLKIDNKTISQSIVGEEAERSYSCREWRSVKMSCQGVLHHQNDGALLRDCCFGNRGLHLLITVQNTLALQGNFLISYYHLVSKPNDLCHTHIGLQSDGAISYNEANSLL